MAATADPGGSEAWTCPRRWPVTSRRFKCAHDRRQEESRHWRSLPWRSQACAPPAGGRAEPILPAEPRAAARVRVAAVQVEAAAPPWRAAAAAPAEATPRPGERTAERWAARVRPG